MHNPRLTIPPCIWLSYFMVTTCVTAEFAEDFGSMLFQHWCYAASSGGSTISCLWGMTTSKRLRAVTQGTWCSTSHWGQLPNSRNYRFLQYFTISPATPINYPDNNVCEFTGKWAQLTHAQHIDANYCYIQCNMLYTAISEHCTRTCTNSSFVRI